MEHDQVNDTQATKITLGKEEIQPFIKAQKDHEDLQKSVALSQKELQWQKLQIPLKGCCTEQRKTRD